MTGIPKELDTQALLSSINRSGSLSGMRVVYWDGMRYIVIRPGPPLCAEGLKTIVIKRDTGQQALQSAETARSRDGRLYADLLSVGLSCPAMVLSWVVVGGSAAAVPITGGASTFIAYLGLGAMAASGGQCLISLSRSGAGIAGWHDELDNVDNSWWYPALAAALDAVSLAGAVSATATSLRMVIALRRSTGNSALQALKSLSRPQARQVAEDIIRTKNPGISNQELKKLIRAGIFPKRYPRVEISGAIRLQLKDALGAALGFTGSATGGLVRRGGGYVAGLAQAFDTY